MKTLCVTPRICRKRIIPLLLWIRCKLPKAHTYFAFSPSTISLTPRFRRKHEVWLRFFAENAQNDPKTHNYEDNAQPCFSLSAKMGSDQKFRISGRIWRTFSNMLAVLRFVSISDWKMQKKFKNSLWKSLACEALIRSPNTFFTLEEISLFLPELLRRVKQEKGFFH